MSSDTVCSLRCLSNKVAANVLLVSQFSNVCGNARMALRIVLCKMITNSETIESRLGGILNTCAASPPSEDKINDCDLIKTRFE